MTLSDHYQFPPSASVMAALIIPRAWKKEWIYADKGVCYFPIGSMGTEENP